MDNLFIYKQYNNHLIHAETYEHCSQYFAQTEIDSERASECDAFYYARFWPKCHSGGSKILKMKSVSPNVLLFGWFFPHTPWKWNELG